MPRVRTPTTRRDALDYHVARTGLAALSVLPWRARSDAAGAVGRMAVRANPRLRARVFANLAYVMPEINAGARHRIALEVGDTFARTALELFHSRDFNAARPWSEPEGPGVAAIEAALAAGRGAVLVSGHFGGWEAIRAWCASRGAPCATIYRPIKNPRLNALYIERLSVTGAPLLPKRRLSVRPLVKHLADGGVVAVLVDQYERRVPVLDFLGKPAPTTTVPAELALKFGVPLVPAFAPRDGAAIRMEFDAPVPPTSSAGMMQVVNDVLGTRVRAHPGQYYWLHRRWSKTLPGLLD